MSTAPHAYESLRIVKGLEDASFLVADLFQAVFNAAPPREPLHYVALQRVAPSSAHSSNRTVTGSCSFTLHRFA
jgi:hypothetical protein